MTQFRPFGIQYIQQGSFEYQAIATARIKGEFPERIGQPECQACNCVLLSE